MSSKAKASSNKKVAGASSSNAHQREQDAPATINPVEFDGVTSPANTAIPAFNHFVGFNKMVPQSVSKPLEIERLKGIPTLYPRP
jgi:hypothetical protein